MGNRAVLRFGSDDDAIGIYLHWNGGIESVLAFLHAANKLGMCNPIKDCYGIARLCQVIGNFFGGANSIGVGIASDLDCDNGDNGLFEIGEKFTIKRRLFNRANDSALTVADLSQKQIEQYNNTLAQTLKKNSEKVES